MQESKQKPLVKSGNIAVWPAKELINGKKVYTVSFEKPENQRTYVSVFANIAGYELKPEEILSLSRGIPVKISDENQHRPTICTIINRDIETKLNEKDGKTYTNHTMLLGAAFHKIDKEGHTFGYIISHHDTPISFYVESGDLKSDRVIVLAPQDCFKLLDGHTIIKGDLEAYLRKIEDVKVTSQKNTFEEPKIYKTARLDVKKINHQYDFHLRQNNKLDESMQSMAL